MVLPTGFPLLGRAASFGQRAALIGRPQASAAGASWSPPSPSLQEDASMEPQDAVGPEKMDRSGPAPTNQERALCSNGTDIKTETSEDA